MIFRLFRRDPRTATITALYGAIVAQARTPEFYLTFGAPDTAEGRFDLIVLHLALFCGRLGREGLGSKGLGSEGLGSEGADGLAQSLSQGVFDMFCRDMDHSLREMGVGDLTVPKKMQKLGEAFYGRLEVYDRALAEPGDDALTAALARNVLGAAAPMAGARRLAAYLHAAVPQAAAAPLAQVAEGLLHFPDPDQIPRAEDCA